MDIQKLILSGYNLSDVKELLALFLVNLEDAKKLITKSTDEQIKLTIHKIKGGLIMLECKDLVDSCCSIEDKIAVYGVEPHINLVNTLLDECVIESLNATKNLEILISNNNINS